MRYTDENRGVIANPSRCRQLIEFRSLKFGNITPMDMDGMMEYRNKAYIFFEYKLEGAEMPKGQRIALERLADDCSNAGKEAVVFLCEHQEMDTRRIVDAGNAIVKKTYYRRQWIDAMQTRTVRERTESFLRYVDEKGEPDESERNDEA